MLAILARGVSRIVSISLLAGLIGATFVRLGPGFGASVQELDPRLSDATRTEIQRRNGAGGDVPRYYAHWVAGVLRGDLGFSPSLQRPISELLRERAGITAVEVAGGTASGVTAGFLLAVVLLGCPRSLASLLGGLGSSVALSVPAAVMALVCLWLDVNPAWAVAAAVLPHAFQYLADVLRASAASDHVLAARARGVGRSRILFLHVVAPVLGEVAAVSGMAVSIAFGASIPIEAICSRPGLGQLVWQAAMSRDLPVLVNMTVLIAVVTIGANTLTDVVVAARNPARGSAR
jgi:peptide/nickel transport system permease protein